MWMPRLLPLLLGVVVSAQGDEAARTTSWEGRGLSLHPYGGQSSRNYWRWADFPAAELEGAHLICVTLFICFAAIMGASCVALMGKPWWPPFQERSAFLLLLTAVAALVCGWATLVTDYHAPTWLGGGQTNARLWLCWLRLVCGFGLWVATITARLQAMGQLYLHDAEPRFFGLKVLQYWLPWLVVGAIVTHSADPPCSMLGPTLVLTLFSVFHVVYLSMPLLPLRAALPELRPTVLAVELALLNNGWISFAIEGEADDRCVREHGGTMPCPEQETGATAASRRFLGTVTMLSIIGTHWLCAHGPLIWAYWQQDPAFLNLYEKPSKRQIYTEPVSTPTEQAWSESNKDTLGEREVVGEEDEQDENAAQSGSRVGGFRDLFGRGGEERKRARVRKVVVASSADDTDSIALAAVDRGHRVMP
jgi:hypothetical protein